MKKIYVHHQFNRPLFFKLAHNTTNREENWDIYTGLANVKCEYNGTKFEFIFNPEFNDNEDGIHVIDFFATAFEIRDKRSLYFKDTDISMHQDLPIVERIAELIKDKKNWMFTFFRTEKILTKSEIQQVNGSISRMEEYMGLLKNHIIVSDNMFLNEDVRCRYPNLYFAFTNTFYQWNEIIGIRWFYEFKSTFDKLTFDYDLCFSVRNHKKYRMELLERLHKLNNPRLMLQRTDSVINEDYYLLKDKVPQIKFNSVHGTNDFSNVTWIPWHHGVALDIFFRLLPKSKMQVLDESWSWSKNNFTSQYLSEKTFGFILAGVPFISTHSYPLYMIQKMLNLEPHPFLEDSDRIKGDAKLMAEFIEKFLENYEENYQLCKTWSNICLEKMLQRVENENSLLELIMEDFKSQVVKKAGLI